MKVVINALPYKHNSSGIGIMLRELFSPFLKIAGQSCRVVLPKNSPPFGAGDQIQLCEAPCTYEQGIRRLLFQSFVLGPRYCRDAVLLTTDSKIPLLLPRSCRLMSLITDLAVFRMSEVYQSSRVFLWRLQYRKLCKRADKLLAISEFTKRELTEVLGVPPEKIEVVPCACPNTVQRVTDPAALARVKEKYSLPEHYLLFVGNYNPRKNLARLIRAFDLFKQRGDSPCELVIAGGQGWKFDEKKALEGIRASDSVHFIGYVPDEDMSALYTGAELFLFPTLYEGFGIPVLEAQRCGTAVLTSGVSSLPEVGGDAAWYVDPLDVEDIARGLSTLTKDTRLREQLVEKGYANEKHFSWEKSARRLAELIEENETDDLL